MVAADIVTGLIAGVGEFVTAMAALLRRHIVAEARQLVEAYLCSVVYL
jgi:hypothetical protein